MPSGSQNRKAEWILTFDDGPLPSDLTTFAASDPHAKGRLLQPLDTILRTLRDWPGGPIRAMFFLRGPAYPWVQAPPTDWFAEGIASILADHHRVGLHCHRHDPDIWRNPFVPSQTISADLKAGRAFFENECGAPPLMSFRPPYGGGGLAAVRWAERNGMVYHNWDIDSEDWLHHPDSPLPLFADQPTRHRNHVIARMRLGTVWNAIFPPANDFLFHVSKRTATYLDKFLAAIEEYTRSVGAEPRWVLPKTY